MSDRSLRLAGIGAIASLLAGLFIAIPATAAAHALVLVYYQPAPIEVAKSTCCGQVLPTFQSEVLPDLTPDYLLGRTLLGLACYSFMTVFAGIGLLLLPPITGLIQLGGD
jgi:hypothetical protein